MTKVYEKLFIQNGGTFCELPPKQVIETDKKFLEIVDILNDPNNDLQYAKHINRRYTLDKKIICFVLIMK